MILRQLFRSVHTNYALCYASNKALLSKLRKKTGYTFLNCKKALDLHDNDMEKAEQWLNEQAQSQGWSQALKLKSRVTSQGLIAMITNNNHGALVEINCETDFVSRNKKFHDLAQIVLNTVLQHGMTIEQDLLVKKTMLSTESINKLCANDGKSLKDHSAMTIGLIGENIDIRRALCMSVQPGVHLYGCTHPTPVNPVPSSYGRYGVLVALKSDENKEILGMQLCQHIIGMNPVKIGDTKVDIPTDNVDDELTMLYQEFLFNPSLCIQELLQTEQVEVLDFVRFEMGENKQILDIVETCG
ncbi:Elongation factor Ts, mitochondrial [Eufriesea mexicana]|uniref:Elongation factor Ts, mitochondrial n=1 Tax=Eufriesea mexicana TaxID=516756 RepID=A0A310SAJ4_9HYME|nr:PREDICTED: elongation factor Ts, mitochondrial [Eufriesea mexicana]XP_017761932.1 PREDICTED: elongation factor Ts, mitochondrial [Eufriesea mexicana]OAD54003.1 Elongation factor Ts, mitochondrial [Eufriesea mexicana]